MDPETGEPHIQGHGVTEEEVRQVLAHPRSILKKRHGTQIVMGETKFGRCLAVVCSPRRWEAGIFVVTAYELSGKALKAYRRQKRRKKR